MPDLPRCDTLDCKFNKAGRCMTKQRKRDGCPDRTVFGGDETPATEDGVETEED